jgi:hypothetical protein
VNRQTLTDAADELNFPKQLIKTSSYVENLITHETEITREEEIMHSLYAGGHLLFVKTEYDLKEIRFLKLITKTFHMKIC